MSTLDHAELFVSSHGRLTVFNSTSSSKLKPRWTFYFFFCGIVCIREWCVSCTSRVFDNRVGVWMGTLSGSRANYLLQTAAGFIVRGSGWNSSWRLLWFKTESSQQLNLSVCILQKSLLLWFSDLEPEPIFIFKTSVWMLTVWSVQPFPSRNLFWGRLLIVSTWTWNPIFINSQEHKEQIKLSLPSTLYLAPTTIYMD